MTSKNLNIPDDEWASIFGCKRHGGKIWADHTMAEKEEDTVAQEAAAAPRKKITREFDSGVVPDLADAEGEKVWKNYVPGVGPVIRNNDELRDYCRITGQCPKGQSHIVEIPRYHDGVASKFRRKVRVADPEAVYGKFDRHRDKIAVGQNAHAARVREAEAARVAAEKKRHETKKYFFLK
ncbi:MAG: hypothetical protein E6Q97_02105 [Desulfurellales bacterium]|nr:MAG: hypothetical protein E6Q97_02105 [Desulfurellales bacterium]